MLQTLRYGWHFWLRCLIGTLLLLLAAAAAQARQDVMVTDVQVVDGDTLTGLYRGNRVTVDFRHIDAPELPQPYGQAARDFLLERLGKSPRVWLDVALQDVHKKSFDALVYDASNQCINFELLKHGLAWYTGDREATSEFYYIYEQEKRARTARIGLWSQASPEPPWVWLARQIPPPPPRPVSVALKSPPSAPAPLPTAKTAPAAATKTAATAPLASVARKNPQRSNAPAAVATAPVVAVAQPNTVSNPLATALDPSPTTSLPAMSAPAVASASDTAVPSPSRTRFPSIALILLLASALLAIALILALTSLPLRLRCKWRVRALERQISSPLLLPFAVVGAVANADNRLTDEELAAIDRFCSYLDFDEHGRTEAQHIVRVSRFDLSTLKCLALRCVEKHGGNRDLIDAMLLVCFVVASADRSFSAEEQLYLYLICAACGSDYDKYADKFLPDGGNDASATLGLAGQIDRNEIRRKLSLLHERYRPALLRRQGLTATELAFALDRSRDIDEAAALLLSES